MGVIAHVNDVGRLFVFHCVRRSLRMSVMWVIILHLYTKFEVRRPFRSKIWLIFGHGVKRSGDLDL